MWGHTKVHTKTGELNYIKQCSAWQKMVTLFAQGHAHTNAIEESVVNKFSPGFFFGCFLCSGSGILYKRIHAKDSIVKRAEW